MPGPIHWYVGGERRIEAMRDDDDRPRKLVAHKIGQKLDELSVGDLAERIALLRAEIERLEADKTAKAAARDAAGSIFRTR